MHFTTTTLAKRVFGAMLVLAALVAPAAAFDTTAIAFVQVSTTATSIPVGHLEFCQTHPAECRPNANAVAAMELTPARWNELLTINAAVNQAVVPVTDEQLYQVSEFWTYPNGYGDCEDFALAKRRDLLAAGWPSSTLLISVVRERNGNGHAVLLVRTDRGDLVLDNQDGNVLVWNETPYLFVKRQSQADAGQWVDMLDDRQIVVAAAN